MQYGTQPSNTWPSLQLGEADLTALLPSKRAYNRHLTNLKIQTAFDQLRNEDCQQRSQTTSILNVMNILSPKGVFQVTNETFAMAWADVLWVFQCEKTLVRPIEKTRCYDAMPVEAISTNERLYILPRSRRLSSVGVPRPCPKVFQQTYRTIENRYVSASPQLAYVEHPWKIEKGVFPNISKYQGISSTDPKTTAYMMDLPRVADAMLSKLIMATDLEDIKDHSSRLGPENIFKGPLWSMWNTWKWVLLASAIIAASILLFTAITKGHTVKTLWAMHGCSLRLAYACCMDLYWLYLDSSIQHPLPIPEPPIEQNPNTITLQPQQDCTT